MISYCKIISLVPETQPTVKSQALDRSTIKFLTIFRVLLNKMMSAVNKNNVDLVKRLLANGTDANYGKTALMYAAFGYK